MNEIRRPHRRRVVLLAACLLACATVVPDASAFLLEKHAFSGGAVETAGGSYRVRGTVGESGVVGAVGGGSYLLGEGFWPGHYVTNYVVDAPTVDESSASEVHYVNGLRQCVPNPFRGSTTISYSVGRPEPVRLDVYNVTGRKVATLAEGPHEPGVYRVTWNGLEDRSAQAASGVYFYRLQIGEWSSTRKLLKLR